jgi:hypothetical protein
MVRTADGTWLIDRVLDQPSRADPVRAVAQYWEALSRRNYGRAWTYLDTTFRQDMHSGSFDHFVKGYEVRSICSIQTADRMLLTSNQTTAVVYATVIFFQEQGCVRQDLRLTFELIRDSQGVGWLITNVKDDP